MDITRQNFRVRAEEEQLKEQFYIELDKELASATERFEREKAYVNSGGYDDVDKAQHSDTAKKSEEEKNRIEDRNAAFYNKPYYAHVRVYDIASPAESLSVMLSDNEMIDNPIEFGDNEVYPFRQNDDAPWRECIFLHYGLKSGESFTAKDREYRLDLIRDVTIEKRELKDCVQYLPVLENASYSADEVLAQKLEENRSNAKLGNIIATLQSKQFEIISRGVQESFVVQGCAGSGKSQCLIHRLFYLRSVLSDRWDKVLLITPTQLFRNYADELTKRFRLQDVCSRSVAELYREKLVQYDKRFEDRQYIIETTEEYLPDEYLRRVYEPSEIQRIELEIEKAIRAYADEACSLLEEAPLVSVDAEVIKKLEEALEAQLAEVKELLSDPDYTMHLKKLAQLEKRQVKEQTRIQRQHTEIEKLENAKKSFEELLARRIEAERALKAYQNELWENRSSASMELQAALDELDHNYPDNPSTLWTYSQRLCRVMQLSDPHSSVCRAQTAVEMPLTAALELAQKNLQAFTKQSPAVWEKGHARRHAEAENRLEQSRRTLVEIEEELRTERQRMEEEYPEMKDGGKKLRKRQEEMEKVRHYLGRLESSIFEQEIWNALAPLKEACGIKTLEITPLADGHAQQDRVLYKSDLLFYLKIYRKLHPKKRLPEYQMICIDEAQDLCDSDFEMLRQLFPKAALNVFGDIGQALHSGCGIRNWEQNTGIRNTIRLETNYRNAAAITDFCRQHFHADMHSIDLPKQEDAPKRFESADCVRKHLEGDAHAVLIVKHRAEFVAFCLETGISAELFEYLDTKANAASDRRRCYTVFSAKGLEFPEATVFTRNMTDNQKTVAFTRAMKRVYYFE